MRFHIGFSKHIKIKTIFEIIAFLFVGLCALCGFIPHAYAETSSWSNIGTSAIIGGENELFHNNDYSISKVSYTADNFYFSSNTFMVARQNEHTGGVSADKYGMRLAATSSYYNTQGHGDYITMSVDWYFQKSFCLAREDNLKKSFNIRFRFTSQSVTSNNFTFFNVGYGDIVRARVYAFPTSDNSTGYATNCTTTYVSSSQYDITCNNIFPGNDDVSIDHYAIEFLNPIGFGNWTKNSTEKKYLGYIPTIRTDNNSWQYSCTDENPSNGEMFEDNDNPVGDVYQNAKQYYDSNVLGFHSTQINYPSNIKELLTLPLTLVRTVVDNSNVCTPYSIDLSSIGQKWGYSNFNYVLTLPCYRSKLSTLLGNLYNIIDYLLAFYVFYNISMTIIQVVEAITSGEDLYTYFFQHSDDDDDKNSKRKIHERFYWVDRETGEIYGRSD